MDSNLNLVAKGKKLSDRQVKLLQGCRLNLYLRAGMTNAEANDAVDEAFERWTACLQSLSLPTRVS